MPKTTQKAKPEAKPKAKPFTERGTKGKGKPEAKRKPDDKRRTGEWRKPDGKPDKKRDASKGKHRPEKSKTKKSAEMPFKKLADGTYRYLATCPEELKELVANELISQGIAEDDIRPVYRGVMFPADKKLAYALHLKLRTVSRIFKILKTKKVRELEDVFETSRSISWHHHIGENRTYKINASNSNKGKDHWPSALISKHVRMGLEDKFDKRNLPYPKVELKEPQLAIAAHLQQATLSLSIDTSKMALHKRGYKRDNHPAPLKETLASALLLWAGYDGSQVFWDAMCGSGTLAIEAAYIALGKAPLIHRSKGDFGFEWLKDFDNSLWREVSEEARKGKREAPTAQILASDISGDYVNQAKDNAKRARVQPHIDFQSCDFFVQPPPADSGILIINLPYGERLEKGVADTSPDYYKAIGDHLKQAFKGWKVGLLVAKESPYKFIGLKPTRKIPVYNGAIECRFLIFDIYAGSRKFKEPKAKN